MICGIILYYLWVVLALYLSYVLLFCTYNDDKRVKFPIYMLVAALVAAFVPFINIIQTIGIGIYMYALHEFKNYTYKTFIFKKI